MDISVFGMGYVGAVTAACLAKLGHRVVGVDPNAHKLGFIREGRSPILEEGLDEMMAEVVRAGRLTATRDATEAVSGSEISLICVGTPSLPSGGLRTEYIERVSEEIGRAIRAKGRFHSVVVRSTVLPGTTQRVVTPILERETGGEEGRAFGVSMHPEFLREGTSIEDFYEPPFTVVGAHRREEFERVAAMYEGSGRRPSGDRLHCAVATAEGIKYGCNIFHAMKVTFANEMGMFCKRAGVDSREVMDILCRDDKLNISKRYLRPGFAFGGSCLPKDLRATIDYGRKHDSVLPMFEAMLASNDAQIDRAAAVALAETSRRVTLCGLSFKDSTDDLRESPLVRLAERLVGRGMDLRIYDPNVEYAALHGSNKEFIDRELPHLRDLLVDADRAVAHGGLMVFGHSGPLYRALVPRIAPGTRVLDLVSVPGLADAAGAGYEGLYW